MTRESALKALSAIEAPFPFAISRCQFGDVTVDISISHQDWQRDVEWVARLLGEHDIGRGSFVQVQSAGHEAAWFGPVLDAIARCGGQYCPSDTFDRESDRVQMFLRRFPQSMVVGLSAPILQDLVNRGVARELLGAVPTVLARLEALDLLAEIGVTGSPVIPIGPALAIPCAPRRRLHVDSSQWLVSGRSGEIRISSADARFYRGEDLPTGIEGDVLGGICDCGRSQRLVVRGAL